MPIRLIAKNDADNAVISSNPTMLSTLPITNLQDISWSKPARSTDTADHIIYVTWNGLSMSVDSMALTGNNLSDSASIRVRFYQWSSWTGNVIYDSGQFTDTSNDKITEAVGSRDTVVFFQSPVEARSVKIDISDSANADGYLNFHRLFLGRGLTLDSGPSYGMSLSIEDSTRHIRAHSGTLYSQAGVAVRSCNLTMQYAPHSEAAKWFADLLYHAKKRDVYLSVLPDESTGIKQIHNFSAKMNESATFAVDAPDSQIITIGLMES